MVEDEDGCKDSGGASPREAHTLEKFLEFGEAPPAPASVKAKPKAKAARRNKNEIAREKRVKAIEKEHKLDGKSMTVNLKRAFISDLRVSQDVWEEVRARTIEWLEKWSRQAEEAAKRKGKKTIQMEDII